MSKPFFPGTKTWFASDSPNSRFGAVFEDDKETGYFYAYDHALDRSPIVDALHVYNSDSVSDRSKESDLDIVWSADGLKAVLLINSRPHALFDFGLSIGCSRTEFPKHSNGWQHLPWHDVLMKHFSPGSA
jgi:hypothetical protein